MPTRKFSELTKETTAAMRQGERVKDVRFTDDTLDVDLVDGRTIIIPLAWFPLLLEATPEQRSNWKVSAAGYGIHWPDIDEDLSTEGLLRGAPAAEFKIKEKTIEQLKAQIEQLQDVCAQAYQLAGVVGAPVNVLDILDDAAAGRPIKGRCFLPISKEDLRPDD